MNWNRKFNDSLILAAIGLRGKRTRITNERTGKTSYKSDVTACAA